MYFVCHWLLARIKIILSMIVSSKLIFLVKSYYFPLPASATSCSNCSSFSRVPIWLCFSLPGYFFFFFSNNSKKCFICFFFSCFDTLILCFWLRFSLPLYGIFLRIPYSFVCARQDLILKNEDKSFIVSSICSITRMLKTLRKNSAKRELVSVFHSYFKLLKKLFVNHDVFNNSFISP